MNKTTNYKDLTLFPKELKNPPKKEDVLALVTFPRSGFHLLRVTSELLFKRQIYTGGICYHDSIPWCHHTHCTTNRGLVNALNFEEREYDKVIYLYRENLLSAVYSWCVLMKYDINKVNIERLLRLGMRHVKYFKNHKNTLFSTTYEQLISNPHEVYKNMGNL